MIEECLYADQHGDPGVRAKIQADYQARWLTAHPPTPAHHPQLFDPLDPPAGWRYDAYYECWISVT